MEINAFPAQPAEGSAMFRHASATPTNDAAARASAAEPESRLRRGWRIGTGIACWIFAVGFAAFAIMRLFGLERTWYLDTLVAFTPYLGLLSILLIPVAVLARRWWPTGLAVATEIGRAHV